MRSKFSTHCLAVVGSLGLGCLSAVACDVFFNFDGADPHTLIPPPYDQFGNAHWVNNGDGTGYLLLTEAVNNQTGVIIFRDCENGAIIGSFAIDVDVRLGGGISSPGEGMSINFARAGDPVFAQAPGGFACIPGGSPECGYTVEEGTTTGLTVSLDEWNNGFGDVVGITIRLDNQIIFNKPQPSLNGDCTDLTGLECLTTCCDTCAVAACEFVPLHMEVTPDGHAIVRYKLNPDGTPHEVTPAGGVATTFAPSPGSLVIGARTSGANSNHHVDNIHIVTAPRCFQFGCSQLLIVTAGPTGFVLTIYDTPFASFDPATGMLSIRLDGNPVTPESVTKVGTITTVKVNLLPTFLPPNSTHQVQISFKDSSGITVQESHSFPIGNYTLIPASFATTHVDPAAAAPGFKVRIHQLPIARYGYPGGDPNSNRDMEHQLADGYLDPATALPYQNQADLTTRLPDEAPDIFYADVINYGGGSDGNFGTDNKIPGIPSLNPIVHAATDWDAMDIEAVLQLKAGSYRFGVNSDDGFLFKFGAGRGDIFGAVAGNFNRGRGAADTTFDVVIPADGFYPIRCDWENGTGGANIEIFTVNVADGSRHLVNDLTDPQSVLAFRGGYAQAYAKSILPILGDTDAHENLGVVVKLMDDGPSTVSQASISMTLDGTPYPNGDPKLHIDNSAPPLTVVTLDGPAGGFAPGSSHTGTISFNGNTYNFNFTVTWLPKGIFVIEAEDFDSTDPTTGITTHNPRAGTPGSDTDYVPVLMPYLGDAFAGLGAQSGVDYANNDGNDSDLYRLGEMPNVNMDPGPGNSLTDHPGLNNRGAYSVTNNYKIGWADNGDWENYTRDFGPTPHSFKVVVALSSDASPPNVDCTLSEVTAGQGTTSQMLNKLGTFSGTAFGGWGVNSIFPLKDSTGDDAVVRYSGVHTLRMNQDNGDFDWFAFVPVFAPAKIVGVSPSAGDTVARNTPIIVLLSDLDTTAVQSSLHLTVNGVDQISHSTVVHDPATGITTITYNPGSAIAVDSAVTYTPTFTDSAGATSSKTVNYMTDPFRGPGDFVIEIEDFNFNAGQHLAISDMMPYYGGAYQDGPPAWNAEIFGIDYYNDDPQGCSGTYRQGLTGETVCMDPGPRGKQDHRSGWDVTTNYKMGWVDTGDWNNYTRVFPKGDYKVYAALSFDGIDADQCHGRLQSVQHPNIAGDQGLTDLGTFDAHGTRNLGGWGWNTLIPMRTPDGGVAVIHLDGLTSLRYNADSGDADYLTFVPADPLGSISGIVNNNDGTVTITWTGPGALQVADNMTGPWVTLPGATSPWTAPVDRPHRFARIDRDEPESWPPVP